MIILLSGALISSLMLIFSLSSSNSYQIFKNLDPKKNGTFCFWAVGPNICYVVLDAVFDIDRWIETYGVGVWDPFSDDVTGDATQTAVALLKGPADFSLVLPRGHFDVSVSYSKIEVDSFFFLA